MLISYRATRFLWVKLLCDKSESTLIKAIKAWKILVKNNKYNTTIKEVNINWRKRTQQLVIQASFSWHII